MKFGIKNKTDFSRRNYSAVIAVVLVFVSFLAAVKLLSEKVEEHYDNEIIVCLDAGHGGGSIGAVSADNVRYEKDDNLRLTLKVKEELEALGVKIVLTREDDVDVSLRERCKTANKKHCDLFVSIHRNSAESGTGFEAWISKKEKGNERQLAETMVTSLSSLTGLADRGVKNGYRDLTANNYYVNANTNMPSILLEVGFISSDDDNKVFDEKIDEMAKEIAKVIYDYLEN